MYMDGYYCVCINLDLPLENFQNVKQVIVDEIICFNVLIGKKIKQQHVWIFCNKKISVYEMIFTSVMVKYFSMYVAS